MRCRFRIPEAHLISVGARNKTLLRVFNWPHAYCTYTTEFYFVSGIHEKRKETLRRLFRTHALVKYGSEDYLLSRSWAVSTYVDGAAIILALVTMTSSP